METYVKYIDNTLPKLEYIGGFGNSLGLDLYAGEDSEISAGEYKLIKSNVVMKIPKNYALLVLPKSSTFKKFELMYGNHVGLIDSTYCGNGDIIGFGVFKPMTKINIEKIMKDEDEKTYIKKGDYIGQLLLVKVEEMNLIEVEEMDNVNRGGFGEQTQLHINKKEI